MLNINYEDEFRVCGGFVFDVTVRVVLDWHCLCMLLTIHVGQSHSHLAGKVAG